MLFCWLKCRTSRLSQTKTIFEATMNLIVFILCSSVVMISANENITLKDSTENSTVLRSPRNFDSQSGVDMESFTKGLFSSKHQQPKRGDNMEKYSLQKEYEFSNYDSKYPSRIPAFNGLPPNPWMFPNAEVLEMMTAMSKLKGISKKKEGFLSGIFSDTKSIVLSLAIPLSIILIAVIPFLTNRLTAGTNVVTTVADSKLGRALSDPQTLESVIRSVSELAERSLQDESCLQRAVCDLAIREVGSRNSKLVARAIRRFGKESWMHKIGAENVASGLESGDCKSVCH